LPIGTAADAYAPFRAEQIRESGLHHAFVGHYHQPYDGEFHTYPGNPDPLTFGETGDRGVVIVDLADDGTLQRERRTVAVSAVHDVELDVTGCNSSQQLREHATALLADLSGVARVTLTGELSPDLDLDSAIFRDLPHDLDADPVLRVRGLTVGYDTEAISQEPTVRGRFVHEVLAAVDIDEEKRHRIIVTGLRALDGRDDLEVL
jgi:DNA repair exonuclease SbcCD nuclease subunit